MHPGWTETEGVKKSIPGFYNAMKSRMRTLEQGADTIVWLALEVICFSRAHLLNALHSFIWWDGLFLRA
jgi:hypothetical protein